MSNQRRMKNRGAASVAEDVPALPPSRGARWSYYDALQFIHERSAHERGHISDPRSGQAGPEQGLRRMRALLDLLGAPDRHYPIVHIAGSKGKGSTAAYAASIGCAAGYRTGLYTSPHLHTFRERIVIDGSPVTEAVFAKLARTCHHAIDQLEQERPELGRVTAFELLTAMGLSAFADDSCDLAVVEVGLGGTFDATNVVDPVVAIITHLDLEHTQILGNTLAEIAENKAGIIEARIPVITIEQSSEALRVIAATAHNLDAPLVIAGRDFSTSGSWRDFSWRAPDRVIHGLRTGMAGPHQIENAALAIAAWHRLHRIGLPASDSAIRQGVLAASLPGRFERVTNDGRLWILDGAHTPVAAAALATELLDEIGHPVVTIAGFLNDKHPEPFFAALAPAVADLILTEPPNPRALAPSGLAPIARASIPRVTLSLNLDTSMRTAQAIAAPGMPILITGSLVLIAEARELLGLAIADPAPVES